MSSLDGADTGHGIANLTSPYSFDDTVKRLLSAFAAHAIKIFATIDQRAEALAVGLSMPPTTLLVYGNPKAGTPLMLARPLAAIDLPLKVLVSEARPGEVLVSFNTAAYLIERHSLPAEMASNLLPPERLIASTLSR